MCKAFPTGPKATYTGYTVTQRENAFQRPQPPGLVVMHLETLAEAAELIAGSGPA